MPSAERSILLSFFVVLWSYGRKICLNMCFGYFENSDDCSYLLRIFFIYKTNVSVLLSWTPLQEHNAFWFTNKRVQIKILSILKLVSFESLTWNDFSERGTEVEAQWERNLQLWNRQLWCIRWKILHHCSRKFWWHYYQLVLLQWNLY